VPRFADFVSSRLSALLLVLLGLSVFACNRAPHSSNPTTFRTAFWVWHRASPLTPPEVETLTRHGATALYWHLANFDPTTEAGWKQLASIPSLSAIRIVPVVRVRPGPGFLEDPEALETFLSNLPAFSKGYDEIQIDYDCPDRLLPEYAAAIERIRTRIAPTRLGVTALASWIDHPAFPQLRAATDVLFPMFYDLAPDTADAVARGDFHPVADPEIHPSWIAKWRAAGGEWHAGLPNFSRISLFKPDGQLRGHIRSWRWEELVFHNDITAHSALPGSVVFEIPTDTLLGGVPCPAGDRLVWRSPDRDVLADLVDAAKRAGATGVAWFRLPGASEPNAWSIAQLAAPDEKAPSLRLSRQPDGAITIENTGPADLPPTLSGHRLEIEGPSNGWLLDVSPGAFFDIVGRRISGDAGTPVHPMFARSVIFRFAALPVGESITSGTLLTAAGASFPPGVRWRVNEHDWTEFE